MRSFNRTKVASDFPLAARYTPGTEVLEMDVVRVEGREGQRLVGSFVGGLHRAAWESRSAVSKRVGGERESN